MTLYEAIKVIRENKDRVAFLGPDGKVFEFNGDVYCQQDDAVVFKFKPVFSEELARRLKHESPVEWE